MQDFLRRGLKETELSREVGKTVFRLATQIWLFIYSSISRRAYISHQDIFVDSLNIIHYYNASLSNLHEATYGSDFKCNSCWMCTDASENERLNYLNRISFSLLYPSQHHTINDCVCQRGWSDGFVLAHGFDMVNSQRNGEDNSPWTDAETEAHRSLVSSLAPPCNL